MRDFFILDEGVEDSLSKGFMLYKHCDAYAYIYIYICDLVRNLNWKNADRSRIIYGNAPSEVTIISDKDYFFFLGPFIAYRLNFYVILIASMFLFFKLVIFSLIRNVDFMTGIKINLIVPYSECKFLY